MVSPSLLCVMRGKRHLPIFGVLKPEPVTITEAHKLVQDDSAEEGTVTFQHASREQLQPGCVVSVQGSDFQDLARNPHHAQMSRGKTSPENPSEPSWGLCQCSARRDDPLPTLLEKPPTAWMVLRCSNIHGFCTQTSLMLPFAESVGQGSSSPAEAPTQTVPGPGCR